MWASIRRLGVCEACRRYQHLVFHSGFLSTFPDSPQKEVYFMGLIDILTQYDAKKKAAHAAKTVKHGVSLTHTFKNRWP